jgi:acetylglutamate kinase
MPRAAGADGMKTFEELGIIGAEKYLSAYRGRWFVIKCGGSLLEEEAVGAAVMDDIALIRKSGINLALVHGGGVQADRDMAAAGIEPRRHKGLRITCDRTIGILSRCFGDMNRNIVELLHARGVDAVGFTGAKGGLVRGEKMRVDDVDLGFVGDMTGLDRAAWDSIGGRLPVISSLGVDAGGNTLNINADYVATKLALLVQAEKLILMTDVDGVMLDPEKPETLISVLSVSLASEMIAEGAISRGMIPKIESAITAVEQGLPKIHMINGRIPHSLIYEIFTDRGIGTQIVPG